jgi:hypothetical protein
VVEWEGSTSARRGDRPRLLALALVVLGNSTCLANEKRSNNHNPRDNCFVLTRVTVAVSDCRATKKICFHRSLAFNFDAAAFREPVAIAEQFVRRRRYLCSARLTLRFHPARCVHRVSPKIENEFVLTNDASYHRPRTPGSSARSKRRRRTRPMSLSLPRSSPMIRARSMAIAPMMRLPLRRRSKPRAEPQS